MSQWSQYGFPNITGVPFGILLEGLYLACAERLRLIGWFDDESTVENPIIEPLSQWHYNKFFRSVSHYRYAIAAIENMILSHGYGFDRNYLTRVTPDFKPLTQFDLAAYLGEKLIKAPGILGMDAASYEWALQRYRMINASYLVQHPLYTEYFLCLHQRFDSDWQPSLAGAHSNLKQVEKTETYGDCDLASACKFDPNSENPYRLQQIIVTPSKLRYLMKEPVSVKIYGTGRLSHLLSPGVPDVTVSEYTEKTEIYGGTRIRMYRYDDLEGSLPIDQTTLLKAYPPRQEVRQGDFFTLDDLALQIRSRFDCTLPNPPNATSGISVDHRGSNISYLVLYDLSDQLAFYDPVEPAK